LNSRLSQSTQSLLPVVVKFIDKECNKTYNNKYKIDKASQKGDCEMTG